jgi:hypothetical protein
MDEEFRKKAKDALRKIGSVFVDKTLPGDPVTELDLGRGGESVTDGLADYFQYFPETQNLYLNNSVASDKLLEALRYFPNLRQLA